MPRIVRLCNLRSQKPFLEDVRSRPRVEDGTSNLGIVAHSHPFEHPTPK